MCKVEVQKFTCVIFTFLNIAFGLYYVSVIRVNRATDSLIAHAVIERRLASNLHTTAEDSLAFSFEQNIDNEPPRQRLPQRSDNNKKLLKVTTKKYLAQHGVDTEGDLWWSRKHSKYYQQLPFSHNMARWLYPELFNASRNPQRELGEFGGEESSTSGSSTLASVAHLHKRLMVDEDAPSVLIPPQMLNDFTLNGTVAIRYDVTFFGAGDTAQSGSSSDSLFGEEHEEATADDSLASQHSDSPRSKPTKRSRSYKKKDLVRILASLYRLIETPEYTDGIKRAMMQRQFALAVKSLRPVIEGREVLVVGSLREPTVEVLMLAIGRASRVISVDHNPFECSDKRIVSLSPQQFWQSEYLSTRGSFDVIVAYSSVQHNGLGRYGDAIDPFGDVKLMWELRALLSPGKDAVLLLGVPLGNDCLVFNRYRVYGRRRLPLLLFGWDVRQSFGFDVLTSIPTKHVLVQSAAAALARKASFGALWPFDAACLGDSQRIPLIVLSKLTAVERGAAVIFNKTVARCHLAEMDASSCDLWLPDRMTESWSRLEGLAGPYPLFHSG